MKGASGWLLPPPSPSLSISLGRNILDVQGRPPLADGQRGAPLERREIVVSPGKWRELLGKAVHYCLCTGAQPLTALGKAEYVHSIGCGRLHHCLRGYGLLWKRYPAPSGGAKYINICEKVFQKNRGEKLKNMKKKRRHFRISLTPECESYSGWACILFNRTQHSHILLHSL